MKRLFYNISVFILVITLLLFFTSCNSSNSNFAVTVGETDVGEDVYTYYLDQVLQGENKNLKQDEAEKQAQELCVEYVKINTEFDNMNLTLSSSAKAEVANKVNDLYNMYGGYYEKIGVTKQTLTNVKLSEAYRDELVTAIFGEGGEKAVSTADQEKYFNENYVFFKVISAYLYTTDADNKAVKLSSNELTAIKEKFDNMKSQITTENTIDAVNKAYVESNGGSTESEMQVMSAKKDTDSYPKGFFEDVSAIETNETKVLEYDNYIFLVQKLDASKYYSDNAKSSLTEMVSEDFSKEIDSKYNKVKVRKNASAQSTAYKTILRIRGN